VRGPGAFVALALLLAATLSAEEARGPRIRVEPESFDFGRVLPGRTLRKEFRLRNLGDATLLIEGISKSCGCTEANTEASTLAPGGATPLLVQLTTPRAAGEVEERVLLRSNDRETPLLEIRLEATVVAEKP
jgi:hypothetical protein